MKKPPSLTSLELCAGAGGQAIGLERAGFTHLGLVEVDPLCCETLRQNRPHWRERVYEADLRTFDPTPFRGRIDLVAAGLPCPPFSVAGKQLGDKDERNLFPAALDIIEAIKPRAVLIENVRGFLDPSFASFHRWLRERFKAAGYSVEWDVVNARDFGVPQLRPRVAIVALRHHLWESFEWPRPSRKASKTVGEVLYPLMAENGWRGAKRWRRQANRIAPTIVGGSKKHGGPDLGPTRARQAWAELGVNGLKIGESAPEQGFTGMPFLTVQMVALLQGFPATWRFAGKKTGAYRQVGNAFPPPVAAALGRQIHRVLGGSGQLRLLHDGHVA
jgi:DNA (cytosine-5)-methyltransferase 1